MTSIDKLIKYIDNISPYIKNKYATPDDLDILINKLDTLLNISKCSKNLLSIEQHYGLDVIFPAIEHLQLFLNVEDLGALALVSKTLYDLMVINFTQFKIDIYILKYYIKTCKYDVNINFVVYGQELSVPIPANIIALQKLRLIIGFEEYYKTYRYILLKSDHIILNNPNPEYLTDIKELDWCIDCQTIILKWCDHRVCFSKHNNKYYYKSYKFVGYLYPEMQHYASKQITDNYKRTVICTDCNYKHYLYEKK